MDLLLDEFYFSFECDVLAAALRPTFSPEPELRPGDVHRRRYRAIADVRTSVLDLCPERVRKRRVYASFTEEILGIQIFEVPGSRVGS